jgi:hypothetical protein
MSGESNGEALEVARAPKNNAQLSITKDFCMAFSAKRKVFEHSTRNVKRTVVSDYDLIMTFPSCICGFWGVAIDEARIVQS